MPGCYPPSTDGETEAQERKSCAQRKVMQPIGDEAEFRQVC